MPLKLFSSPVSPIDHSTRLDVLTIAADAETLRVLANFLHSCADEIEMNGPCGEHREFHNEPEVKARVVRSPEIFVSLCV